MKHGACEKQWRERTAKTALLPALLSALVLASAAKGAEAPAPDEAAKNPDQQLDRQIDAAIKHGVDFLLSQKKSAGDHWAGNTQTAAILFSLLQLGDSIDDPRLQANSPELAPVAAWVTAMPTDTALDASFKALALCRLPLTPETKTAATAARDALLKFVRTDGSITSRPGANTLNTTETRWAYLALAALEDYGVEIDPALWKTGADWWRANQLKDAGWPDIRVLPNSNPVATAAATAALELIASRIPTSVEDTPLETAIHKTIAGFDPRSDNPFYLYLFECAASGAGLGRTIGDADEIDWYRAAARQLLKTQQQNGSWDGPDLPALGGDPNCYATAFALLFLARGRNPVIFNKLEYGAGDGHWNDRPRDDANLTAWLSRELGRPLNWRIVTLQGSGAQLSSAPILLITGSGDPQFTAADLQKLRAYVDAGGLIFSSADNGDLAFTNAIIKKYAPALSGGLYPMQPLPKGDPLLSAGLYAKISPPPALLEMSNGIRAWWIHSPADIAASWQQRKFAARENFLLPANLLRYVTGNGSPRNKLQMLPPLPTEPPPQTTRTIHLARLQYAGNWNPEPAAWPRLAAFAPQRFHTTLTVAPVKIEDLDFAKTPVAQMTGTAAFQLTDDQTAALKKFLDAGGTLIADAAGASPAFTDSFTALMKTLYPAAAPAELAVNDPVFNGSIPDSAKITEAQYRNFGIKERQLKPRIEALTLHGRHVILFSPLDITSGLLGTQTWGIRGYTAPMSQILARNLLLYSQMAAGEK